LGFGETGFPRHTAAGAANPDAVRKYQTEGKQEEGTL
jgi:hypothetical protein